MTIKTSNRTTVLKKFRIWLCLSLVLFTSIGAQSIEEKKAGLGGVASDLDADSQALLEEINLRLSQNRERLSQLQAEALRLHRLGAPADHFPPILKEIRSARTSIRRLNEQWHERLQSLGKDETYALWHQPETNLEQLVADYGSQDYVYLIPPEVAYIKCSVNSNIPIPRESWGEVLELILGQNGVGIRELNPFLRELFLLSDNQGAVELITSHRSELVMLPSHVRACFVIRPEFDNSRRVYQILEKFVRKSLTTLQLIGAEIYVVGRSEDITEILKIYDFVRSNHKDKQYKLITLSNGNAEDMAQILEMVFAGRQLEDSSLLEGEGPSQEVASGDLRVLGLKNAGQTLFLFGTPRQIQRAEKVIRELDDELGDAREKTIYWYKCKHSDAEEIAQILDRVYNLMRVNNIEGIEVTGDADIQVDAQLTGLPPPPTRDPVYDDGVSIIINPNRIDPSKRDREEPEDKRANFIVDAKTGSIIMVVEPEYLLRLKDLLRKIDVPKKMVQLDVIVFEKTFKDTTECGLELLKLGDKAAGANNTGLAYNDPSVSPRGILDFMYGASKSSAFPAVDVAYRFLTTQEDVQINANPSVTTINQTPARLYIQQESSLSTGVTRDNDDNTEQESFVRAQYGISIEITPNIHEPDECDDCCCDDQKYVTLETKVNFDTIKPDANNRPTVDRREIQNEVRILDGQTLILGGLRRKDMTDNKEAIPFLGEIPCFGKIFSHVKMTDTTTEMFIFITPTIISDQCEDVCCIKRRELMRRPGDSVEFVERLKCALDYERQCRVVGVMKMIFGRYDEMPCCDEDDSGEYDGC